MAKIQLFNKQLQDMAAIFKALSHPARLAILKYLAETRVCISGDVTDEIPLSRTTVHQHLSELKKFDLIKGEISGAKTNYCLNQQKIRDLKSLLDGFLADIDNCAINKC